jgi:hypothetical protein
VTPTRAYCTILSSNYLPRALALGESLRRHEDGARLQILFIDADNDAVLSEIPGVDCLSTSVLDLPRRELHQLATAYDLVELATAVKPLLLKALLARHDQVVYLDPDTYVTAPLAELGPALDASGGGIVLTPHFLHPTPPDAEMTEGHMLFAGVYNLGFCAVDRRAGVFLDWWWGHLERQCLFDPLAGLFYDQKWMDIGATMFEAGVLRHPGYNVGVANLPERPVGEDADGYSVTSTGERLRLFHFHAFDSSSPATLSTRHRHSVAAPLDLHSAVLALCKEYAGVLGSYEQSPPGASPYPYAADTHGRPLPRLLRRAYLAELQAGADPPVPFVASDAVAFDRWRRAAKPAIARQLVGTAAKCARIVLPEEYDWIKKRFPKVADRMNDRFAGGAGQWG